MALSEPLGENWRIGEEGERILARRCSCPRPLLETDADGWTLCVICGREPAIRLGPSNENRTHFAGVPKRPANEARRDDLLPSSVRRTTERYMDQQINFRADEDLARALAEAASREERTISAEIRYAVRKHLNETSPVTTTEDVSRPVEGRPIGEQV